MVGLEGTSDLDIKVLGCNNDMDGMPWSTCDMDDGLLDLSDL
jgi:hypothetical protein